MAILAPSILAADFSNLPQQLQAIERAKVQWLHIDVMDGHFVPNLTLGPDIVAAIRRLTSLFLDVHLMVQEPDFLIPRFRDAGADLITVHVEAVRHLHRSIQLIKQVGAQAGVSLNPATPASSLDAILPELDLVLVMSVNPGYGGQTFIPAVLPKISQISQMIRAQHRKIYLEVDGGITVETAPMVVKAGATVLVAGTAIFKQRDIGQAVAAMRQSVPLMRDDII
ncbi:MAG: ribulose-phosphate 3-epimerase [candidate division KSB1 bacterium]|nr:ribulose-phosphate 3-epimerase [candidate division KSB1 bacterium]MDZ7318135.1 ribulose-phosphate 3-epimerase [candidate division KSB1 bacterium]MDZ7341841.1 ribulose-phosphate 3-epimerase [candidate division KSB1 bacterium]